jgi:hypothetical protein
MKYYHHEGIMYTRTPKNIAYRLIAKGARYFLVGSNVNTLHFHSGWYLASHPCTVAERVETYGEEADTSALGHYTNFGWYLDKELGKYPVFYVEVPRV